MSFRQGELAVLAAILAVAGELVRLAHGARTFGLAGTTGHGANVARGTGIGVGELDFALVIRR